MNMSVIRFDLFFFLCWFVGTLHAIFNDTNIQFFTQERVSDDFEGFTEQEQDMLEKLIYNAAAKHAGQTSLNDTESYKKAFQLLLQLSHALDTPNKEDFCREYTSLEKHIKPFFNMTIKKQFMIVNDKNLFHQVYGDEDNFLPDIRAMLVMIETAKTSENVPSVREVQQLMDTIEEVDLTLDEFYEENFNLIKTTEHLLRTICMFLIINGKSSSAAREYWNDVIKTSGKDEQWKWMEAANNYTDIEPLILEINEFLSSDESDSLFDHLKEKILKSEKRDDISKDEL